MGIFGGRKSAMRKWVAQTLPSLALTARPADFPQAHSDGADADRVLLLGSGRLVGWGSTSHAESLAGTLAAALSDRTTRGTDVDVLAAPELLVAGARALLPSAKLWRFDLIVVNIGLLDAALLTDPEEWRDGLVLLLSELQREPGSSTRIVLLGIEPVGSISAFVGPHVAEADAHARKLDAVSEEIVAGLANVSFITLASDATNYPAQARELAGVVLADLYAARESSAFSRGPAGQDAAEREAERMLGVVSAGILDTPSDDRFDRIVTMARQLYGTSGAAFALVDRDRVWHKSASAGVPDQVPRDASFCSTTILGRGSHVVPDASLEGIPTDSSIAEDLAIRFYAGYPIESPKGEQIGALCVFDEKPRDRKDVDESMLRQLALLIQAELQVDALGAR